VERARTQNKAPSTLGLLGMLLLANRAVIVLSLEPRFNLLSGYMRMTNFKELVTTDAAFLDVFG